MYVHMNLCVSICSFAVVWVCVGVCVCAFYAYMHLHVFACVCVGSVLKVGGCHSPDDSTCRCIVFRHLPMSKVTSWVAPFVSTTMGGQPVSMETSVDAPSSATLFDSA